MRKQAYTYLTNKGIDQLVRLITAFLFTLPILWHIIVLLLKENCVSCCVGSLWCGVILGFLSSLAIKWLRKRELAPRL